jgi:hypothetical protein
MSDISLLLFFFSFQISIVSILSEYFATEIAVVQIETGHLYIYRPEADHSQRIYLLYDGLSHASPHAHPDNSLPS